VTNEPGAERPTKKSAPSKTAKRPFLTKYRGHLQWGLGIAMAWIALGVLIPGIVHGDVESRGLFGDQFGAAESLFTAATMYLLWRTLEAQAHNNALLRKSNTIAHDNQSLSMFMAIVDKFSASVDELLNPTEAELRQHSTIALAEFEELGDDEKLSSYLESARTRITERLAAGDCDGSPDRCVNAYFRQEAPRALVTTIGLLDAMFDRLCNCSEASLDSARHVMRATVPRSIAGLWFHRVHATRRPIEDDCLERLPDLAPAWIDEVIDESRRAEWDHLIRMARALRESDGDGDGDDVECAVPFPATAKSRPPER
jgi:hypothetical protein